MLHIRARKGSANTSRGALRFVEELIPRVARAGATRRKLLRADSGFWNVKIMTRLQSAGWTYSIGVRQQTPVKTVISAIPEADWQALPDYPETGEAQIAETMLGARRLIVRRTRLVGAQAELWPDWRHFAFVTNRTDALELVEAEHRGHAVVELAIRDLKDQALAHFPSGKFLANAAWTVIAALAHNLLRWTTLIGLPDTTIPTARTLRRRLLTVPGRLTRTARSVTLRLPARWPWQTDFLTALARLRAVPRADLTHDRGRTRSSQTPASACPEHPDPAVATVSTGPPRPPGPPRRTRAQPAPRPAPTPIAASEINSAPNGGSRLSGRLARAGVGSRRETSWRSAARCRAVVETVFAASAEAELAEAQSNDAQDAGGRFSGRRGGQRLPDGLGAI